MLHDGLRADLEEAAWAMGIDPARHDGQRGPSLRMQVTDGEVVRAQMVNGPQCEYVFADNPTVFFGTSTYVIISEATPSGETWVAHFRAN